MRTTLSEQKQDSKRLQGSKVRKLAVQSPFGPAHPSYSGGKSKLYNAVEDAFVDGKYADVVQLCSQVRDISAFQLLDLALKHCKRFFLVASGRPSSAGARALLIITLPVLWPMRNWLITKLRFKTPNKRLEHSQKTRW